MKKQILLSLVAAGLMTVALSAAAFEAGDWTFKLGMTNIDPDNSNGTVAGLDLSVDDDTSLSFLGEYFFTDAIGLELLASLPFDHDWTVGGLDGGNVKHLPPTLSLKYHFNNSSRLIPYVGAGVNYTIFFDEDTHGALNTAVGDDVDLDNSLGLALQAGVDFMIDEQLFFNVDVRYIDIDSDVKIDGKKVGKANIDPVLVGVHMGYRF
jgi:outer membrane protein